MGLKNVIITFNNNLPKDGYVPGIILSGFVRVVTKKRTHIDALNITLQGKAKVAFYSNQVRWFQKHYRFKSGDTKEFGLGGILHFDMNDIKIRRRLSERECFMAKETLVDISYQLAGDCHLEEGETEFPFSIQLPTNLPSSFSSCYGDIKYKIKVKRIKHGLLSGNETFKEEIIIKAPKSCRTLQKINPKLLEPMVYKYIKPFEVLWSSTLPFSISVSLPRSAIVINETVNAKIDIDNTSDINITSVSLKVVKRTAWIGKRRLMKNIRTHDDVLQEIHYDGVPKGIMKSWSQPITVTTGHNINIDDCSIIKLFHLIKVKAVAQGLYGNCTVYCPFELCDPVDTSDSQDTVHPGFGFDPPPIGFVFPSTSASQVAPVDLFEPNMAGLSLEEAEPRSAYSRFDSSEPPPPYPGTPEPPSYDKKF